MNFINHKFLFLKNKNNDKKKSKKLDFSNFLKSTLTIFF
jgi:hypothetical protein